MQNSELLYISEFSFEPGIDRLVISAHNLYATDENTFVLVLRELDQGTSKVRVVVIAVVVPLACVLIVGVVYRVVTRNLSGQSTVAKVRDETEPEKKETESEKKLAVKEKKESSNVLIARNIDRIERE